MTSVCAYIKGIVDEVVIAKGNIHATSLYLQGVTVFFERVLIHFYPARAFHVYAAGIVLKLIAFSIIWPSDISFSKIP